MWVHLQGHRPSKALLLLAILLSVAVSISASAAPPDPIVQVSDAFSLKESASIFSVVTQITDKFNLIESLLTNPHLVKLVEQVCIPGACASPLTLTETVLSSVANSLTTVTATIIQIVTSFTTNCGGASVCSPVTLGDTGFDTFLTYLLIPAITLMLYLTIALAMKVRSFSVLTLFGAVGVFIMGGSAVLPAWFPLLIVFVLAGLTSRILGSLFTSSNPFYGTLMFLLLIGAFTGMYTSSTPTVSPVQCQSQITTPPPNTFVVTTQTNTIQGAVVTTTITSTYTGGSQGLSQQVCNNGQVALPCLGNILGVCIVSDILNGLTGALSIFGSLTSTPWSTALTLGFIFLVAGIVAGIFGFGQLMNVVFAVGLAISVFYYINSELALIQGGVPALVYTVINAVIGVSDFYMFYEAFRGSAAGGGGGKGK